MREASVALVSAVALSWLVRNSLMSRRSALLLAVSAASWKLVADRLAYSCLFLRCKRRLRRCPQQRDAHRPLRTWRASPSAL